MLQSATMKHKKLKIGVLLSNLGTPEAPTAKALRKYLREFLSDPYVVTLPRAIWLPILYGLVLPLRSRKSAAAYQKIWTASGSPLLVNSKAQLHKLQQHFADHDMAIALGMRYGKPSISDGLQKLTDQGANKIFLLPLYPQYSCSTTKSTIAKCTTINSKQQSPIPLTYIESYEQDPKYIAAIANSIKNHWQQFPPGDKILFSFHGLPEQQVKAGDPYATQCKQTANLIADELQIPANKWQLVFQSRFGSAEWLQPYCDKTLAELPKQGIKNVDIICPGFASDCLETLEEIKITNQKIFKENGGENYNYIPALNASDAHIDFLAEIIKEHALCSLKSDRHKIALGFLALRNQSL